MTTVQRFDTAPLKSPTFTPQGFLKAEAYATRVGIFKYQMMDGSVRKEFRPPDEVTAQVSVDTLSELPVTNDHPFEAVTAENAKQYQIGYTGKAEVATPFIKVGLTLTDKDSIAEVMDKRKDEVSCGYTCEVDLIPGEWQGESYDCVQRNIRYNHLAIVPMGRAGADCRIKVDRADGLGFIVDEKKTSQKISDEVDSETGNDQKEQIMAKIKIDKVEYELPEGVAPVVSEKLDALEVATKAVEELTGKVDALSAELEKAKVELEKAKADAPTDAQMIARAKARLELEEFAKKIVGDAAFEGKTDTEIKASVVAKVFPETDLTGKSDGYVDGAFAVVQKNSVSDAETKAALGKVGTESSATDSEKARKDAMERARNAWKPAEKTA